MTIIGDVVFGVGDLVVVMWFPITISDLVIFS